MDQTRGTEGAQSFPCVRIPAFPLGTVSKSFSPTVLGKPFKSSSWPLPLSQAWYNSCISHPQPSLPH